MEAKEATLNLHIERKIPSVKLFITGPEASLIVRDLQSLPSDLYTQELRELAGLLKPAAEEYDSKPPGERVTEIEFE